MRTSSILRLATTGTSKPVPRQGRKGHLYEPAKVPKKNLITPEEEVRILKRRVQKAERDERMDISNAIIPPKTYMGGFTRPRDLRAGNWFPGGPYRLKGKVYESPHEEAYRPHTVFLMESRYKVRQGLGRVDCKDHIVGVCRAQDWVKLVKAYNSKRCPPPYRESMDNACWPWLPHGGKVLKPTKWWGKGEKLSDALKEIYEDPNYDTSYADGLEDEATDEADELQEPNTTQKKGPRLAIDRFILPADPNNVRGSLPQGRVFNLEAIQETYVPTLENEPFWLPLIAVTLSTRPLALTLARLSRGLERGLPFYASMTTDDRKCLISYSHRMTSMRLRRVRQLTHEICRRLAGYKGGFVGIRFAIHERGRGIEGEGLADPIPREKRLLKVQVGNFYEHSAMEAEAYRDGAVEAGGTDAIDVAFMNIWGRRLDENGNEVPLTAEETSDEKIMDMDEYDAEEDEEEKESFGNDRAPTKTEVEEEEEDKSDESLTPEELSEEEQNRLEEEKLLKSPLLPNRVRWKFKDELRGDNPTAAELRRKLAYKLGGKHSKVARV